jgi:hypothetical protein
MEVNRSGIAGKTGCIPETLRTWVIDTFGNPNSDEPTPRPVTPSLRQLGYSAANEGP